MACGWSPDLLRMLEGVGDEKQKLAQEAAAELARTTQQVEALKQKAAARAAHDGRDWTAVYDKWDAWEDPEELAQREREAREKQERAAKAAAAAGCNHDHSAEQRLMDMTTRAKLDACAAFRALGNAFYKQGQYQRAAYHYHKALVYFEYVFPETQEEEDEMDKLKLATLLNFTACRLKTGHLEEAIHHADMALEIDAASVKALYRRAQAFRLRDEFDKAMDDITAAIEISHKSQDAVDPMLVQEKQLLQAKILAYKRKSKQLSLAMFGGGGAHEKEKEPHQFRGVSGVKDVPLLLRTTSVVGAQPQQTEWRLDETWRPITTGLNELQQWLDAI